MSAVTINMEADKHLEKELSKYSSSFNVMKDIRLLTQKYLNLKRDGLIEEVEEFDTKMEKCRTYNLISFLYFLVGNTADALAYNKKSLDLFPDNIIGLSNQGWFLYKTNQKFRKIEQLCTTLIGAQKDSSKTIVAKAEIAYTYSRLGIHFYRQASLIYQDALSEAKRQLSDTYEDYICLWSFGSALAQSRLFTTFNVCNASDLEISKRNYASVCELSRDIINNGETSMTHKLLRPRAYVLLGIVADDIKFKKELFPNQMKSFLPENTELHLTPDEYFEEALKLQNNDVFVLDRCGQHFECTSNIAKAIRLLRKSISIKASSFAHHHLALALTRQLEMSFTKGPYVSGASFAEQGHIHSTADEPSGMTGGESKQKEDSPPAREIIDSSVDQMVGEDSGAMSLITPKHVQWRMINSPKEIQIIDYFANKAAVDDIIYHHNVANDLAMNNNAIYDKGLLLRQTNQVDAALDVFKSLVRNEHHRCSLVVLANAYEQAGFCFQELLTSSNSNNKENDEEDMKMYFKKSLEISCNIVAKLPELENCWESAPTLKSFLLGKAKTKQNLKDLSFLYKKMKAYQEAVDVLSRLRVVVDTEGEQAEICRDIIEQYFKMKRFDDAVLILEILMCLPKLQDHSDQKLFIEVYIEGAFDAFKKGDKDVACLRFDNAFDFSRRQYKMSEVIEEGCDGLDKETSEMNFSILILCNPDHEDNGEKILQVLQRLGVTTTLNNHETLEFGKLNSEVFAASVRQAKHYLVVYDFEHSNKKSDRKLMRNVEMMTEIVLDRGHGNVLTLVSSKTEPSDVPRSLPTHKKIVYNFEAEQDVMTGDIDNIKKLLVCLAMDDTK